VAQHAQFQTQIGAFCGRIAIGFVYYGAMPVRHPPIRIQFGFRGWAAIAAALVILITVATAIAFLAVGLFVFLLPALLIAPILYWLMPKPKPNPISHTMNNDIPRPGNDADVIEGEFTVVSTAVEHQSGSHGENQS
jgi:hypothetical protein